MGDIIAYFSTHGAQYAQLVAEHIGVSALALGVAMLIAVPAGIACARWKTFDKIAVGASSILRIIPSLAVLVICVPILGTGVTPAVIALSFLAIPPILVNTAVAFRGVPADVLEAAWGMGMDSWRIFWTVRVPLAFPTAFAGIRTAASEVIASATLASYIGGGGLGEIIFTGIGLMRTDLLVIGGSSVALLSILCGACLGAVDKRMRRYELV